MQTMFRLERDENKKYVEKMNLKEEMFVDKKRILTENEIFYKLFKTNEISLQIEEKSLEIGVLERKAAANEISKVVDVLSLLATE